MENTPHLYDTLVLVLRQHATWLDQRHLKTLAWMMVGLIHSGWISLTRLGSLCGESRPVRAEYSATVSPLARQRQD